jgi:large subunit ribosomal protein L18
MNKIETRQRRRNRTRNRIARNEAVRLSVHRTPRNIYAQIIDASGSHVLASASTLEAVGKRIADKAKQAGISKVAFDRSGFKYHGRIKALADAARENGLEF